MAEAAWSTVVFFEMGNAIQNSYTTGIIQSALKSTS